MAHRALALKYRPQGFGDLVGQEHVSLVLGRAIEGGRVAQAYLFAGARGVGKTTSARILAKALNCETRANEALKGRPAAAEPCNQCPSCREITAGISLDVAEIDGASNRGIADVQALREKVRFTPAGGRYRVVIIDEVHQLSNDAFAALLKTLEEPPPHLVFIFATTDPQKVPETIRSRTQRFDFARVPLRKVAARLQEIARRERDDPQGLRFELTEGAALLIAQKSEGSIRDAVSALDQVVSSGETPVDEDLVRRILGIADREVFFDLVEAIVRRDPKHALRSLHAAFDKGLDAMELADGLAEHVRHLLVLKVDPGAAELVPVTSEELARLQRQAETWSEGDLLRLLRIASDLGQPMRDSSQPMVHLEAAVLQMATLEPGETLGELIERLESLEQRLQAGSGTAPQGGGAASGPASSTHRDARPAAPSHAPAARPAAPPSGSDPARPRAAAELGSQAGSAATAAAPVSAGRAPSALLDREPAPALDPEIAGRWERVLEGVNATKRMLGAFLQESRFVGVTESALVLAMDDLHRSVVGERENRDLIEHHARTAFGRMLALECRIEGTATRPASRDVRPLIDRAIQFFEGDVITGPGRSEG